MILYNVTTKIMLDAHDEWLQWMQEVHVPDVMRTGYFQSYRLCKLDEVEDAAEAATYVFQYIAKSREDLNTYFDQHAPALRDDVVKKFQDKFIAFRTIMEVVSEG